MFTRSRAGKVRRLPVVTSRDTTSSGPPSIICAMETVWDTPAVDSHCHAFDPGSLGDDLLPRLTLSEEPLDRSTTSTTLLARRLVADLASFLGCEADEAAVNVARSRAIAADRQAYVRALFDDAGLEILLCDTGYPVDEELEPVVGLTGFAELTGRDCFAVTRVEHLARRILRQRPSFAGFVNAFDSAVDEAVDSGAVALKSIVAYTTGLDVELTSIEEATRSYAEVVPTGDLTHGKALNDFLFVRTIEKAIEHDVPLQIHTGMGDGPWLDMSTARPILLRRVLFDAGLRRARLVLTHAGYPWVEESGWLASQYANVFVDISEMTPFASSGLARKLLALLEMAPTDKIMFGTDGFGVPEIHWLGAKLAREALDSALSELMASGWIDAGLPDEIARKVLRENALRIYRLDG